MASFQRTIVAAVAILFPLGTTPAIAQSGAGARRGAATRPAGQAQARGQSRTGTGAQSTQRGASTNRAVNANCNVNVNRNVDVNRNVTVNRNVHWNGNYWGGSRIAAPRYAWPRGYSYVRRPVGWIMPRAFLTSAYYYTAWATLGLMAPPAHHQWVRYGPDLLLVNTATGQVTDVRYGVFAA